ncbi:MAG: tail fiber domain-containing protein, partial [Desulfuromonadaceae bacterium]
SFHVDIDGNIWSGAPAFANAIFSVSNAGELIAQSATIAGSITATSGAIGGFTVDVTDGLYAGSGISRVQMKAGVGLWAGADLFANAPTSLSAAGLLVATGAIISGAITAISGTIGGWTASATEGLYAGAGATRIQLKPGVGIWAGADTIVAAPTSISAAGLLVATGATISGAITATSGIFTGTVNAQGGEFSGLITGGQFVGGSFATDDAVDIMHPGVIVDTLGIRGYANVGGVGMVETFNLPINGDPPTFYKGIVKETQIEIYTSGVIKTSVNALIGAGGTAGVLINPNGVFAGSAGQDTTNANFRVTATTGALTATGATIQSAASSARIVLNSTGLAIYDATAQRAAILATGAGWLGAATTFAWTTAGVVTAGGWTINNVAFFKDSGANNTSAGMAPADYPFYAGAQYANRAAAPFRVTPAGLLTATGATISGAITITSGSVPNSVVTGLGALALKSSVDLATAEVTNKSLANVDSTANTKLAGIAAGATVGATWGTNLYSIPATLGAPSGSGLFLSSTYMGYYTAGVWKTYIASSGNMILGDPAGTAGLSWNQGTGVLTVKGAITATSGSFSGAISASTIDIGGADATSFHVDINGNIWSGAAAFANGVFRVSNTGALTATGATISGAITALSGTIGGFILGTDYIRDSADSFGLSSTITVGNDVRFWAGASFANRATAPFRIHEDGTVGLTTGASEMLLKANVSGTAGITVYGIRRDTVWDYAQTPGAFTRVITEPGGWLVEQRTLSGNYGPWMQLSSNGFTVGHFNSISTTSFGVNSSGAANVFVYVNGGFHVGGTSNPGDNNLLVDGSIRAGLYCGIGAAGASPYALNIENNIANARGIQVKIVDNGTGNSPYGLVTELSGTALQNVGHYFHVANGTINIGVQFGVLAAGANNYCIYSTAEAKSYHKGRFGVGTGGYASAPRGHLDVNGASGDGIPQLCVGDNGGTTTYFTFSRNTSTGHLDITSVQGATTYGVKVYDLYTHDGGVHSSSDIRLKNVDGDYLYGLPEILKLNPISFRYKNDNQYKLDSVKRIVGLSAQEVKDIIPDAVEEDDCGYLSMTQGPIFYALINAVKELNEKITLLEKK